MPPAPDKEVTSLPEIALSTVQLVACAGDELSVINEDLAGDTTASDSEVGACPQYPDTDDEPEVGLDITADKNPATLYVCRNKLDDDQKSQTSTWSSPLDMSNMTVRSTFLEFKDVQAPSRRVKTMPPAPDKEVASLPELALSTVQVLASAAERVAEEAAAEATTQKEREEAEAEAARVAAEAIVQQQREEAEAEAARIAAEEEVERIAEEAAAEAIAQKEREEAEVKAHPAWADIVDEFHDYTITASLACDNVVATDLPATTEVVPAPCQPSPSVRVLDGATYAFPTPPPLGSGFTLKDGKYQLKLSSGLEITFKDGTYHAQWDVDAKRFTKNDRHMVSPEFNMWFSGKAVPYKIGIEPLSKNFQHSEGQGRAFLKCEALTGEEQKGITRFCFFLESHCGAEVQSEEHNFSKNCKSIPAKASALNFKAANDRGSVHIHLEVSQEPEVIEPEVIVLEETEPEVTETDGDNSMQWQ